MWLLLLLKTNYKPKEERLFFLASNMLESGFNQQTRVTLLSLTLSSSLISFPFYLFFTLYLTFFHSLFFHSSVCLLSLSLSLLLPLFHVVLISFPLFILLHYLISTIYLLFCLPLFPLPGKCIFFLSFPVLLSFFVLCSIPSHFYFLPFFPIFFILVTFFTFYPSICLFHFFLSFPFLFYSLFSIF